jgi:dolichol-phosphate mannosyltransferase
MTRRLALLLALIQSVVAIRVLSRLVATARGDVIRRDVATPVPAGSISVLVPVLDEERRLGPCLASLATQGPEVGEILVIDGGSTDCTRAVVEDAIAGDRRIRFVDGAPVPAGVNGKAYNLMVGLRHLSAGPDWVLTIDADVRADPTLARSLLAFARRTGTHALSVATRQRLSGSAEGLVHPAMLATLVYRYGIPGRSTRRVREVQANGQCMLVRRDVLDAVGGFAGVLDSVCEDVTLARAIAASGVPVGFHEAGELVSVAMYGGALDAWSNWSRSLPMRDRYSGWWGAIGLIEVTLAQALPSWLLLAAGRRGSRRQPLIPVNLGLVACRIGVLAGMARAYERRPWSYWLSPLLDLPVALRLWQMAFRRRHTWRGRALVPGGSR